MQTTLILYEQQIPCLLMEATLILYEEQIPRLLMEVGPHYLCRAESSLVDEG